MKGESPHLPSAPVSRTPQSRLLPAAHQKPGHCRRRLRRKATHPHQVTSRRWSNKKSRPFPNGSARNLRNLFLLHLVLFLAHSFFLRFTVASLSGVGLGHVLAVFRLAIPSVAFLVEHLGRGVHPNLAASSSQALGESGGVHRHFFRLRLSGLLVGFGCSRRPRRRRLRQAHTGSHRQ